MEIHFYKLPGNRHRIEVRNRSAKAPDIFLPARETGPSIPHDLAHAAVEAALKLDHGFWAAIAAGATFEGFMPLTPSRHRRSGLKELRTRGEATLDAEIKVSWAHRVWSGQRTTGRGLKSCPLDAHELTMASLALDQAKARWESVPEGSCLVWSW